MSTIAEKFSEEIRRDIQDLEQLRGELGVQLHLMGMEAKTRWFALEKKWEGLRNDAKMRSGTVARQYAEELKTEYGKLKQELRSLV